jgi:hypothetical protein
MVMMVVMIVVMMVVMMVVMTMMMMMMIRHKSLTFLYQTSMHHMMVCLTKII